MFKKVTVILMFVFFLMLLVSPGCKAFVWDPTGMWSVTFDFYTVSYVFTEQLTFIGSDTGGSVSGFTFDGDTYPQTGTWTKTGDYSLTFQFVFNTWGEDVTVTGNLTSSEANPNNMSGTGTDQEDSYTWPLNITAVKTSNLQ